MQELLELLTNDFFHNRVACYGHPCHRKVLYHILAAVLVGFILDGCQSRQNVTVEQVSVQQISSPFGDYNAVAWLTSDQLVVQYEPEILRQRWTNLLWIIQIDGSNLHALNLPKDGQTKCEAVFFTSPTSLPDGRLAFERDCHKLGLDSTDRHLLVWDPKTHASQLLYDYELPVGNALFTFAPDLSRGLMSSHTAIEDRLFWLDTLNAHEVNVEMARANKPTWSPDGESIAFWGNQSLPGQPGPNWATRPYDLWLMPTDCEAKPKGCANTLQLLLKNVLYPNTIQWSPNGQWLVFDGELHDSGEGIWLLNIRSKTILKIVDGDYIMPKWSPDGKQIVVIGPEEKAGSDEYRPALYILNVSEIMGESTSTSP